MIKQYWLMKSEPSVFSIDDLRAKPNSTDRWEGVRNYQARNYIKAMKKGDLALFYHSNCELPGLVGIIEIVREPYPDDTAFDPGSRYFDTKSTREKPRWFMVDVTWKEKFKDTVSLAELREVPELSGMAVLKKGQRLSVMPAAKKEFEITTEMGRRKKG